MATSGAPTRAPTPWEAMRELRLPLDVARLFVKAPLLARQPRGTGQPVMVLPGFGAGDPSTAPLRHYLRWLGYDVHGWAMGTNRGNVRALLPPLIERVRSLSERRGQRVRLVGWSLGGSLARQITRAAPPIVERVVTLAAPVVGGPKFTTVGRLYEQRGYDLDTLAELSKRFADLPPEVPVTAVYSRSDGVVAWQACIDEVNPWVEHVEVRATHVGMGVDPDVMRIVARRLTRPDR